MKLLNRLRDLRNETNSEQTNREQISDDVLVSEQHQDLLGLGTATIEDVLRLNIADKHLTNLYLSQD